MPEQGDTVSIAVSPYNREPYTSVHVGQVTINDCTLREGEQAAKANFPLAVKLEIAERLQACGIRQVQVGYPGRSEDDKRVVGLIRSRCPDLVLEAVAQVFTDDWKEQIDAAVESGADIVDLIYPASEVRLRVVQRVSEEEALRRSVEAVAYAKKRAPLVRFAPTDTTRARLEFLRRLYAEVVAAGADRISVADTAGAASPAAMRFVVSEAVRFGVPVHVHCHNDLGLALANTLAAVEAGAAIVDATVNGLGERCGNTCLAELATCLTVLYGLDLGIRLDQLTGLSEYVAQMSGIAIPPDKPLVGRNAFAHKLDAHVWGVLADPRAYEAVPAEVVGNVRRFPVGKYSGKSVLAARLARLGVQLPDEQLVRLAAMTQETAVQRADELDDRDLLVLVQRLKKEGG